MGLWSLISYTSYLCLLLHVSCYTASTNLLPVLAVIAAWLLSFTAPQCSPPEPICPEARSYWLGICLAFKPPPLPPKSAPIEFDSILPASLPFLACLLSSRSSSGTTTTPRRFFAEDLRGGHESAHGDQRRSAETSTRSQDSVAQSGVHHSTPSRKHATNGTVCCCPPSQAQGSGKEREGKEKRPTHPPPHHAPKPRTYSACTAVMPTRFSVSARWAFSCASCACRWVYCLLRLIVDAEAEAEDGWAREDVEGRCEGADILKDYLLFGGWDVGGRKGFFACRV